MLGAHRTRFAVIGLAMSSLSCSTLLAGGQDPVAELQSIYASMDLLGPVESEKPTRAMCEAYVTQHPELDLRTRNLLLGGNADLSMTGEQFKVAWGEPLSIEPLKSNRVDEAWRYASAQGLYTLVYFKRGVAVRMDLVTAPGRVISTEHSGLY